MLFQCDADALFDVKFPDQKIRCFVRDISLSRGQEEQIRLDLDPRFFFPLDLYIVIQINRLHDHPYIVIPILSSAENIQPEIDLGKCFQLDLSHVCSPLSEFLLYI